MLSILNLTSKKLLVASLCLFFVVQGHAFNDRFRQTRADSYLIPDACKNLDVNNFDSNYKTIIYGLVGAKSKGFTNEWNMTRDEASILWKVFRGYVRGQRDQQAEQQMYRHQDLQDEFNIFKTYAKGMGFDFEKEGDLLEMFALVDLQKVFNPRDHFFTGGFEYRNGPGESVLGELDILVGRKSDCKIIVVGEAKLGTGALPHAKQQLARFSGYLKSKLSRGNFVSIAPQVRRDAQGRPFDQYGYLLNYDEDASGRGYWTNFR